jgi:hypothetical protein
MRSPLPAATTIGFMTTTHKPHPEEMGAGRVIELLIIGSLHFWPRLFILGFVIFSPKILMDAFSGWVAWVAGFWLAPWTTITYMMVWGVNSDGVYGVEWVFVAFAVLLDIYTWVATLRK